jgi:hypothetical protein
LLLLRGHYTCCLRRLRLRTALDVILREFHRIHNLPTTGAA